MLVRALPDGGLVVAVADGAGSAPLAAEGSALAVAAAVASVEMGLALPDAFAVARDALGDDDEARAARATTLLVAVLCDDAIDVGQVGDGFVVVQRGDGLDIAVPAPEREYLNETTFLSSAGWEGELRLDSFDAGGVDAVALSTDGLQLVALDLAAAAPHPGFFAPLFSWAAGDEPSDAELAAFLASERVAERTDDDVTLALVVRAPCST